MLVLILIGETPFAVAVGLVGLAAAAEFAHGWLLPSMPLARVLPLWPNLIIVGAMITGAHWNWQFLVFGLIIAAGSGLIGYVKSSQFGPRKPYRVTAWAIVYIGAPLVCMVLARDFENGREWILLALLATFATDTGAYATGKLIGRHKLAPRISPGKTIEGAIGGYAAGVGAVFALNALLDTGTAASTVLHLAVALPLFAQAGDLFESWMKRRMGVKDSSGLLPGHGGFLDRLDSILFVMPLLYLFLELRVS